MSTGRIRGAMRRPVTWAVLALVVVAAGVALAATQPWKLFLDERVDEGVPVAAGGVTADEGSYPSEPDDPAGVDDPASAPPAPTVLSQGSLTAKAHPAAGEVLVLDVADGSRYVRLEDLATDNGPDLRVYLSTLGPDASDDEVAADADAVDLGALKGNLGNQNYEVPPELDLSSYRSVVIWCERFTTAFGAAPVAVEPV